MLMNHKIASFFNLFISVSGLVLIFAYFSVRPKLQEMYSDFNQQVPTVVSFNIWLVIALVIVNLFFASKLLSKKSKIKDQYFNMIIIATIISFFLLGGMAQSLIYTTIVPIYNLTNQF